MEDNDIYIGKNFETYEEAELFIKDYCKRNYHPVNETKQKENIKRKKVSHDSNLPESLGYTLLNWKCKHFGVFKSRGTEKRRLKRIFAMGCKFEITVTYNRIFKRFAVIKANLEHINHEISPEIYAIYPDHRKPNPERMIEVDNMLKNNVNLMLIANMLHSEGSQVRIKDLHNRKRKLIKSQEAQDNSRPIDDYLCSVLSQPGIVYQMLSGSDNMFDILFFQTTKQQKIFSDYKEVVQIDATYKNPDLHYSLYTLLVEDKNGLGQPIAFGLLEKPEQYLIETFLEFFMEKNDITGIQCFVIDKDEAEMNAIKKVFPDIPISIYYFHVLKAVDNYLSSYEDLKNKKTCLNQFNLILKSKTPEEFYEQLQAVKSISLTFHEYIIQNWLPFKQNIMNFYYSNLMTLQNLNNNRLKRFHNLLKGVLGSIHLPLNEFLKSLLKIVDDLSLESLHKQFDMNMKSLVVQPNDGEYYNHFTDYAAHLISKEIKKINTIKYSIYSIKNNQWTVTNDKSSYIVEGMKCSCGMPTQMGLPCQHLFAVWNANNEPLFQPNSVASRWKKRNGSGHLSCFSNMPSSEIVSEEYSDCQTYLSHTSGELIHRRSKISNSIPLTQPNSKISNIRKETVANPTNDLISINYSNDSFSQENSQISSFSEVTHKLPPTSEIVMPANSKTSNNSKKLCKLTTSYGLFPQANIIKSNEDKS